MDAGKSQAHDGVVRCVGGPLHGKLIRVPLVVQVIHGGKHHLYRLDGTYVGVL